MRMCVCVMVGCEGFWKQRRGRETGFPRCRRLKTYKGEFVFPLSMCSKGRLSYLCLIEVSMRKRKEEGFGSSAACANPVVH